MTRLAISFNCHFFAAAVLTCAIGVGLIYVVDSFPLQMFLGIGVPLAIWLVGASIIASSIVDDASDLHKLNWWPSRTFVESRHSWGLVHPDFHPSSLTVHHIYPDMQLRVLEFFDGKTNLRSLHS